MTDTFYPDISHFQAGINLTGTHLVMAKATEGTTYKDASYPQFKQWCNTHGVWFAAYHFLHQGSAAQQAGFAHSVVPPGVGLMIDCEPTGRSNPGVTDVRVFTDAYRQLGGKVHLVYFPRWYWEELGEPDLRPLSEDGLSLVSSNYTTYADNGPGWQPYGGLTPAIWQYTDTQNLNGTPCDYNAFKGTQQELERLVIGA